MNTKDITSSFAAPVFFYLAIVLYFLSAASVVATLTRDVSYIILGLVTFVLAYNAWEYGKSVACKGGSCTK